MTALAPSDIERPVIHLLSPNENAQSNRSKRAQKSRAALVAGLTGTSLASGMLIPTSDDPKVQLLLAGTLVATGAAAAYQAIVE